MRRTGSVGRLQAEKSAVQSVRDGEISYLEFMWRMRYPSVMMPAVVALLTLFTLVTCPYMPIGFVIFVVLLSWIATFAGITAFLMFTYEKIWQHEERRKEMLRIRECKSVRQPVPSGDSARPVAVTIRRTSR